MEDIVLQWFTFLLPQQVPVGGCRGEMPNSRSPFWGMPHDFSLFLVLFNIYTKQMGEIIWKQVVPSLFHYFSLFLISCFHLSESGNGLFLTHDRETHSLTKPMNNLETFLNAQLLLENQVTAWLEEFTDSICVPILKALNALFPVIHDLVTSQLDYCNILYMRLPLKTICRTPLPEGMYLFYQVT